MRYLSADWIAAADRAVSDLQARSDAAAVGYAVTGGPDGDVSYTVVLGPDAVSIRSGIDLAGVVLTLDWGLASAIAQGQTSAQRAFLDGAIRVGGDVRLLVGNADTMVDLDDKLAELRSITVY